MISYTDAAMKVVVEQYLPLLTTYYDVGAGKLLASEQIYPLAGNPTDAQIQQAIAYEIQQGNVPQTDGPNSSVVYAYFLAPGQVVSDPEYGNAVGGYHSVFNLNGWNVPYMVIYSEPNIVISQIEAHEIAETVTDPEPLTGWADRARGGAGEVGDILMWNTDYQFQLDGYLFSAPAAPDGSPIGPPKPPVPPTPTVADCFAIAVEEVRSLVYRGLALLDPRDFSSAAIATQQQIESNTFVATPQGHYAVLLGEQAFAHFLSQE